MNDTPTEQQQIEAFQALFYAPTLDKKREILEEYGEVLLRKYSYPHKNFWQIAKDLIDGWGADKELKERYWVNHFFLDTARRKGIDKTIQKMEKDRKRLPYLIGVPGEQGVVLASAKYIEARGQPHPLLRKGELVSIVAFPSFLEIRKFTTDEELLSVPYNNITGIVMTMSNYAAITYNDPVYNSELLMSFQGRLGNNTEKLTKQLNLRLYDYQRQLHELGS